MKIDNITNPKYKNQQFKAKIRIRGKKYLTDKEIIDLEKRAKKIGKASDELSFTICKITKEKGVNLSNGIEAFNRFRRSLYVTRKIDGKQSAKLYLSSNLIEVTKYNDLPKDSILNNPFLIIDNYLKTLT